VLGMPRRGKRPLVVTVTGKMCAVACNEVTEVRVWDGNGRQERLTEISIPAGGSRRDEI
jgi:hypothetical protein